MMAKETHLSLSTSYSFLTRVRLVDEMPFHGGRIMWWGVGVTFRSPCLRLAIVPFSLQCDDVSPTFHPEPFPPRRSLIAIGGLEDCFLKRRAIFFFTAHPTLAFHGNFPLVSAPGERGPDFSPLQRERFWPIRRFLP